MQVEYKTYKRIQDALVAFYEERFAFEDTKTWDADSENMLHLHMLESVFRRMKIISESTDVPDIRTDEANAMFHKPWNVLRSKDPINPDRKYAITSNSGYLVAANLTRDEMHSIIMRSRDNATHSS